MANQRDERRLEGTNPRLVRRPGPVRPATGGEPTSFGSDPDPDSGRDSGRELRRWADLRVADADREYVVGQLGHVHAEGRIDLDELDERMTAAWAARTYGELAALTADLPFVEPARPTRGPHSAATPPDDHPGDQRGAPLKVAASSAVWAALALINLALLGGVAGAGIILLWWVAAILAACTLLAGSKRTSSHPGRP